MIDLENAGGLAQLMQQNCLLTEAPSGLLPETKRGPVCRRQGMVLDRACDRGDWALELAVRFSKEEVIGVDTDPQVIE